MSKRNVSHNLVLDVFEGTACLAMGNSKSRVCWLDRKEIDNYLSLALTVLIYIDVMAVLSKFYVCGGLSMRSW